MVDPPFHQMITRRALSAARAAATTLVVSLVAFRAFIRWCSGGRRLPSFVTGGTCIACWDSEVGGAALKWNQGKGKLTHNAPAQPPGGSGTGELRVGWV